MEVVELEMVYAYPERRLVPTSGQTACHECLSGNYKTINPRLLNVTFEGENGNPGGSSVRDAAGRCTWDCFEGRRKRSAV